MADELSVIIRTKLEIDEQQARQELEKFGSNYSSSNNGSAIKIPIDIDEKVSNTNVSSFITTLTQRFTSKPIQAIIGVNEAESFRRINASIASIQSKLKSKELKINVGVNSASTTSGGKSSTTASPTLSGVDYSGIAGAEKYVNRLVEKAKQFKSSFSDATAKIASTDIAYKPIEKMWQATVKYEDSIGRTTSMMFSMNEGMEEINVTQLKVTENAKKYRQEIESSLAYLDRQEAIYNDMYSKAFRQKNKLLDSNGDFDDFGLIAYGGLDEYHSKITEIRNQGFAITQDQKRELETLRKNADRTIKEQQTAKWGATDFASKNINSEIEVEYTKLDTYLKKIEKLKSVKLPALETLNNLQLDVSPISPTVGTMDELNKWRSDVKLAKAEIDNFLATTQGKALSLSLDIDEGQLSSIKNFLSNDDIAKGTTNGVTRLRQELQELQREYTEVSNTLKTEDITSEQYTEQAQKLDILDERFESAAKAAKLFNDSLSSNDSIAKSSMQIEKLKSDLDRLEVDWSKALQIPELKADLINLRTQLNNADAMDLPNIQKAFAELRSKIKSAGADCKSFGSQLKDTFTRLKSYFTIMDVFQYTRRLVQNMTSAVKEIDSAMVELKKVTNLSELGYDEYTIEAAKRSKVLGTNMTDYISGTADFARLGYNVEDAQALSESTNMLYKVGDGFTNIEQASDAVIASMAAYGLNVSDVTSIVDKFNQVSNKTSINTVGLTEAITRSASALAITGLDLDKSLALIVAGNETVRDASATGTALKSLSLRIRGAESDLQDMGEETDDYTKSTSKLRAEIKALTGVDIMVNDSTFKDLYDIMGEISKAYEGLSDIDRANVTEILFGKQRASVGASVLLNFDKAQEALAAAQDSAGSAALEHERWMQSIEASQQRASAAFQEFSMTVMGSGLIKGVYDTGTGFLGFLTAVVDKLGAIPTLVGTIAGALSFKGIGLGLTQNSVGATKIGFNGVALSDFAKQKTDVAVMNAFNDSIRNGLTSQQAFRAALNQTGNEIKNVSAAAKDMMLNSENGVVSVGAYTHSVKSLSVASAAASIGVKMLSMALSTVAVTLITSAIFKAIQWFDDQIHVLETLEEKLAVAKESYQKNTQEVSNLKTELESVNEQIASIQAKGTLETTDQEQLNMLEKQRASLETQLSIAKELEKISLREVSETAQKTITQSKFDNKTAIGEDGVLVRAYLANQNAFMENIFKDSRDDLSDYQFWYDSIDFTHGQMTYEHSLEAYITAYRVSQEELKEEQYNLLLATQEYEAAAQSADKSTIKSAKKSMDAAQQRVNEWKSSQSEISQILSDEYQRLQGYLEGMERFSGNNLTAAEQYINKQFDLLDDIGLYLLEAGGQSHWNETFNVLKARYSEQVADLESWIAQGNTIDPLTLAHFAPDLTHAFSEFGFNANEISNYISQELSSKPVQAEIPVDVELSPYEAFTESLFEATEAGKILNEALAEQLDSGTLSAEMYKKLVDENAEFANFLDQTASGYALNIDAVNDYIAAQKELDKGFALSRMMELQELLADTTLSEDARAAYQTEITQLQMLVLELDNATGAFARYSQAKSTANQDAMYQTGTTMYEEYKEAYEKGKTGTDDFQTSVAFALGDDWETTHSSKDEAYKAALQKLKKYFGDEDEKKNAVNFLNALADNGFMDEDGNYAEGTTLEAVATKLGTSQDLVRSLFGLLETYEIGPEIDFSIDKADEELAARAEQIKALEDKVNSTQTEIDNLTKQYNEKKASDGSELTEVQLQDIEQQIAALEAQKAAVEQAIAELTGGTTSGTGGALSVDTALERLTAISEIANTLASSGIEIPIHLTGEWEKLSWFLGANGVEAPSALKPLEIPIVTSQPEPSTVQPDWGEGVTFNGPGETIDLGFNVDSGSIESQIAKIEDNLVLEAQLEFGDGSTETFDATTIAEPLVKAGDQLAKQAIWVQNFTPEIGAAAVDVRHACDEVDLAVQSFNNADSMTANEMQAAAQNVLNSCSNLASAYTTLQSLISATNVLPISADTSAAQSAIDKLSQTVTVKVQTVSVQENAKGTKYAKPGASLVDEEGAELIERKKTGTYELGTNQGARLTHLEQGDVVHTAEETKQILGRKASVGGAFASGLSGSIKDALKKLNAVASTSSTKSSTSKTSSSSSSLSSKTSSSSSSKSTSSSKSSSSSSKKNSTSKANKYLKNLEKLFDWIEIRLEKLQAITDSWVQQAAEAIGYVSKNASLDNALSNISKQISESNKAYNKYMSKANDIAKNLNLSASIVKKIQEGTIEIASYSDSQKERIEAYKEWYDKAVQVKDALVELNEQQKEIAASKLDNVINHYQWQIDRIDAVLDYNASLVDLKGATGKEIFSEDYTNSIDATSEKIDKLNTQRAALAEEFAKMVDAGYIVEGSEQWYEYQGQLDELDVAILEASQNLQELIDLSNQVTLTNLQYALTALEQSANEVSKLMDLHEAQGADHSVSDYESLIRNGMQQISNLREQNAELFKQQDGLDVMSEKYQELQDQINSNNDAINEMMISQEQWNDAVLDLRINEIQKYKDELSKVNDQYERQQALQQAIEDLERAKTQRTVKTYVEGEGWVYRADQSAVQDAQKAFDQAIHNETMNKLDDLIEAVENLKSDSNVYTSSGVLLGEEYTLPSFVGYAELLNSIGGKNIVSSAMDDAKKAAYEQVMGSVVNSGKTTTLSIGDIIVQGVETPDALAEALLAEFPQAMLQAMHNKL